MSLEVRKQRSDKNPPAGQKKALGVLLAATPATADVDLRPDPWHHLRVRIQGDTMEAWLAGVRVASLRSPGIGHPTKTSFGFTVNGSAIDCDNVKVFKATDGKWRMTARRAPVRPDGRRPGGERGD